MSFPAITERTRRFSFILLLLLALALTLGLVAPLSANAAAGGSGTYITKLSTGTVQVVGPNKITGKTQTVTLNATRGPATASTLSRVDMVRAPKGYSLKILCQVRVSPSAWEGRTHQGGSWYGACPKSQKMEITVKRL